MATCPLLDLVHVVLLRPRWASNVGAVARAMKNFGLSRLTLVAPRFASWSDAFRMAVHAGDLLEHAGRADDLAAVVADARWLVGTSDRPPPGVRVLTPRELAAEAAARGAPTLLFGGEIGGLEPAELRRCHAVSTIPVAAAQSSLNLAQAVAIHAAELFAAHGAGTVAAAPPAPTVPGAPAALLRRLELALARLLADSAWHDADRSRHALAELLQPFWRAAPTEPEVRAWLVALGKATQRARRLRTTPSAPGS